VNPNIADAMRFWEQGRIAYNLLLTVVFLGWTMLSWPALRGAFSLVHLAQLAVLALIANILYCAAYLTEMFSKRLAVSQWHQWRWAIFIAGTLFAILIESYWVNDEIIAPLMH
jgi:formate hydrogenlyase subunit 4